MIVRYAELSAQVKKDEAACDVFKAKLKATLIEPKKDLRTEADDLIPLLESWPADPKSLGDLRKLMQTAEAGSFDLESAADFNEMNRACDLQAREDILKRLIENSDDYSLAPAEQRGLRDAFFRQSLEQDSHPGSLAEIRSQLEILRSLTHATWIQPKFSAKIKKLQIQARQLHDELEKKQTAISSAESALPFVDHIRYELVEGLKVRQATADLIRQIQRATPVIYPP